MRRISFFGLVFSLVFSCAVGAEKGEQIPGGQNLLFKPAFNKEGSLVYPSQDENGNILIKTVDSRNQEVRTKTLALPPQSRSVQLKRDRDEKLWILWEEWEESRSRIFVGLWQDEKIIDVRQVGPDEGFNHSSNIFFDALNLPSVAWIQFMGETSRIYVENLTSGVRELTHSVPSSSVTSPKIIYDARGDRWLFWTQKGLYQEEIFYKVFDGRIWSKEKTLLNDIRFPCLTPDVCLDASGNIRIVWSGYDGQNYELFSMTWNGFASTNPLKITETVRESQMYPIWFTAVGDIPAVLWIASTERGTEVNLIAADKDGWSERQRISKLESPGVFPSVTADREKIGIIWPSRIKDRTEIVDHRALPPIKGPKSIASSPPLIQAVPPSRPLYNPLRDDTQYIGFGDSITYGYINRAPAPEKGYIPRLETIIKQVFGAGLVVNSGVSGESTQSGLGRIESVLSEHMANYLLLMEGTNDAVLIGIVTIETAAFNLKEMVGKSLATGTLPAIATIIPRLDSELYTNRISTLNQLIRQISSDYQIPMFDAYSAFNKYPTENGGLESLLSEDKKHPSEKGYQYLADNWFEVIWNFPFPPVNVQLKKETVSLVPRIRLKAQALLRVGNTLTWQDNTKIFDQGQIGGYAIYRRKIDEGDGQFVNIAFVAGQNRYTDTDVLPANIYVYAIATVRNDGLEGACSKPISARIKRFKTMRLRS